VQPDARIPANEPGNKDGWSVEKPGWIIDSVGFAGPAARYTLTMMNSLQGEGNYQDGTDTVTQVAAILSQGHQIPHPPCQRRRRRPAQGCRAALPTSVAERGD
jgi:hypothetical protein